MSQTRLLNQYTAIHDLNIEKNYPVCDLCHCLRLSRSGYYKWLNHTKCRRQLENESIAKVILDIHTAHSDKGYRRIRDDLDRDFQIKISDKRSLRLCRAVGVKSSVKYRPHGCTRAASGEKQTAENILNRNFSADKPNQKWCTDVTEFKWYEGEAVHKLYLSAIIDLCDHRIVSYALNDRNNNELVLDNFHDAMKKNPGARPLLHSDRGYQYTSHEFHRLLAEVGMTQSMSRVGRCIDNAPMEGFWGILKRECYYRRKFRDKEVLIATIESYIDYYNFSRYQRRLRVSTPMEVYERLSAA